MSKNKPTEEQQIVLNNKKKKLIVSASAGSGKTFVVIEYLKNLICKQNIPVSRLLVLTFTKAAASEIKTRLYNAILENEASDFLFEQIDDISVSDITTIDAFCEKLIKRNINKIDVDEGFSVLDQKACDKLKQMAFGRAFDWLSRENEEEFNKLFFSFKKNKDIVSDMLSTFQSFFDSLSENEKLVDYFIEDSTKLKKKAKEYIADYIYQIFSEVSDSIKDIFDLPEKYEDFKQNLLDFCLIRDDDFLSLMKKINDFKFERMPSSAIENKEDKNILAKAKDKLGDVKKIAENYKELSPEIINNFDSDNLAEIILKLYKRFSQEYKKLKKTKNGLDFADLELYSKRLLEDYDTMKGLQEKYDYIFIDEYQDTNMLQESIIKPISQNGHFIAVGDLKQGIYGFRNASMEIMQNDIKSFSQDKDGDALFLKGNFRTDKRILNFVNEVFLKVMTEKNVGIDYKNTSMLEGLKQFKHDSMPAVRIDIVENDGEKEEEEIKEFYSVKEDDIVIDEKHKKEVETIASRIEECLESEIYDAKLEKFRKVEPRDISLLFRGTKGLMVDVVNFLQNKGFDIVADIEQNLLEDKEIKILLALLKIAINKEDDISLIAVMNSWFGKFSLDEIVKLRIENKDKTFSQIIAESQDEKINDFKNKVDEFYFDCQVIGISKAINKLFVENNFELYLSAQTDVTIRQAHIDELFRIIKISENDFNIAGLIEYLEKVENKGKINEQSTNAIYIGTIHSSKGLEYPIVFLCEAGKSLKKSYQKPYFLTKEFGLGTNLYDFDKNLRTYTPQFVAGKLCKQKKEFIDEIMIFYVALTRAQNHLFIIGERDKKRNYIDELSECENYLDFILFAFGSNFSEQLFEQDKVQKGDWEFNIVTETKNISYYGNDSVEQQNKILNNKIAEYIDFEYEDKENCRASYKNSVTGILKLNEEEIENVENHISNEKREISINRGNAYHEALKIIDFSKISNIQDLQNERLKERMSEGSFEFIDLDILLKNILLIKSVIGQTKPIKEKQFIMQSSLKEIGVSSSDKNVIVQGIVDLFCQGEKTILIDYKFTSEKDEKKIIEKYEKQIKLYTLAIEKAFNKKVDEKYLLSLKDAKLIKL